MLKINKKKVYNYRFYFLIVSLNVCIFLLSAKFNFNLNFLLIFGLFAFGFYVSFLLKSKTPNMFLVVGLFFYLLITLLAIYISGTKVIFNFQARLQPV